MAISSFFVALSSHIPNAKAIKIRYIYMPATGFEEDLVDKTVKIVRRL